MASNPTGYEQFEYSANTDSRVFGVRRVAPRGSLVHTTSGTDSLYWLTGGSAIAGKPAGADYLINRQGRRYHLVDSAHFAYHAGVSTVQLAGAQFFNDRVSEVLIGIELECLDSQAPTYEQYDSLAELLTKLSVEFNWRWPYTIFGHYAVARPVGRRADPVGFNWGDFMGRLYTWSVYKNVPGLTS